MGKPRYALACAHQWDAWWRYLHDHAPACRGQAVLFDRMARQSVRAVLVEQARQGYFPTWVTWNRITPSWWVRMLVRCTRWLGPHLSRPLWQMGDQHCSGVTYGFVLRHGMIPTINQIHHYGSFEAAAAAIERKSNQLALILLLLVISGIVGQAVVSFWCAVLTMISIPLLVWHGFAFANREGACSRGLLLWLGIGLLGVHWIGTVMQVVTVLTAFISHMLV